MTLRDQIAEIIKSGLPFGSSYDVNTVAAVDKIEKLIESERKKDTERINHVQGLLSMACIALRIKGENRIANELTSQSWAV